MPIVNNRSTLAPPLSPAQISTKTVKGENRKIDTVGKPADRAQATPSDLAKGSNQAGGQTNTTYAQTNQNYRAKPAQEKAVVPAASVMTLADSVPAAMMAPIQSQANTARIFTAPTVDEKRITPSRILPEPLPPFKAETLERDQHQTVELNRVKQVTAEPVSTFSVDVDTASYSFVRRQLNQGRLPNPNAVRVEEMVNYFDYDYTIPTNPKQPFQPTVVMAPTPWNPASQLMQIGIKGYQLVADRQPRSNLVFLLDVSGS
ncbi:MAG: von Willebrand factor type A domain-containing protein, partial [Magnetococcales bacterium]|nr:von Willebrand factor type A domain-containing protein [Magnetococcales bacterium]